MSTAIVSRSLDHSRTSYKAPEKHLHTKDSARIPALPTVDAGLLEITPTDLILAETLRDLRELVPDYRTAPIATAFNWSELWQLLPRSASKRWYLVVFRSVRKATANSSALYDADHLAHEEAKKSGGILKYWYGDLNDQRECLAMCVWASRDFAKRATTGPDHVKAMRLAAQMYETYRLERYWLIKDADSNEFHVEQLDSSSY
ncbi:hypothetical protein BC832DRAFT_471359 [Gaertneriomyces semiglobifer]|nr:hypothetical protein BC832DRAFT_471359 [Gaertneriomyces semiglobifer]